MGKKKIAFRPLWPKLWGFKEKRTKKRRKSAKFECRFGVRLTFWPATQAKKVKIQNGFFPQNPDFAGLMMGPKKFGFWPF